MIPDTNINQMNDHIEDDPYDVEKCAKWIEDSGLTKVCLQFPDNLLPESVEVAVQIESRLNSNVYILGDTSCGSCCVDEIAAQHINADGIIHFGHACLNPTDRIPVFHVLPRKDIDVTDFNDKFQSVFKDHTKKIIFFYDVAHAHKIEQISKILSPLYKCLIFSTLNAVSNVPFTDTTNTTKTTAILGRCFTLENEGKVEDYEAIFLGADGKTLTTLSMSIPVKKWYYFDDNVIQLEPMYTPWLRRRRFLVEKLKDAKVVGIVVATLAIKEYLKAITMIKTILKQKNIKSYILSVGKVNPPKLANFPEIDVFVMIACPENEVFDSRDFLKPILMPYEVDLAFNSSRESNAQYCMDFRQLLPGGMNYSDFKPSLMSDVSLISGEVRATDNNIPCTDKMNALAIKSTGTVVIGKAGAQFLHNRSWQGVEQRLGKDTVHLAEIGRSGLPGHYENEPVTTEKYNAEE